MCGALESDLDRYYGKDLRGLYTTPRTLTLRQVWVRIRHLPDDSALAMRGVAGEEVYSFTHKLMATIVNEQRIGNYYFVTANSEKRDERAEPDMIDLE